MNRETMEVKNSFVYEIKCDLIEDDERFVIKGNLNEKEINKLIFYLQVEFRDRLDGAILIPYDISEILTKLYGFEEVEDVEDSLINQTIELVKNIDENIDKVYLISNMKSKFYVNGLNDMLSDIKIEIVKENPTVFEEEYLKL